MSKAPAGSKRKLSLTEGGRLRGGIPVSDFASEILDPKNGMPTSRVWENFSETQVEEILQMFWLGISRCLQL